ncbi:acetaldehyde dehydrogenase (acetylating) [Suicoccus acidiformans]|uniref:Acetaldehyde dehydrogenase (Acetylating) n=1 Tax=Suicoccus acidiformans TaxID=2036206 RepID=A0A347WLY8_9LACT|nr:acetaldehyde dehydrogenase (acetylating) [Suicoccus acidiformans]AXY26095.1 acetaldehyde dehydrogenase (acetylating) [Suicoccus acidiformans]
MTNKYKDLVSIEETRNLLEKAQKAQKELAQKSQEEIDAIIKVLAKAAYSERERLARLAVEETGFGNVRDKLIKNAFASKTVADAMKEMKTIDVIEETDTVKTVAVPKGVIAGLVPSTNPTSTVIYKSLIAIKSGNAIVFSPHPSALKCIIETAKVLNDAGREIGLPEGTISVIENITMQATDELMKNKNTDLILATGGSAMVKAAYSSGTPAIGVGPGNGPAFIHGSADIPTAVRRIFESKTFDNGTICASEQSIIVEKKNKQKVKEEFEKLNAYFLNEEEAKQLEKFLLRPDGRMNAVVVGKKATAIAELAGIDVPAKTNLLLAEETRYGGRVPYSREILAPILGFYTVDTWQEALELSINILLMEGAGHTMSIHAEDQKVLDEFSLCAPVSRLVVNSGATFGGIGASTDIFPALTLGCGSIGGSSTSDNVSPLNLFDTRLIAKGTKELGDILEEENLLNKEFDDSINDDKISKDQLIDLLVEKVLEKLQA